MSKTNSTQPSRQKQVTLTQIRGILRDASFNPKTRGPMKILNDIGAPDYYITHAQTVLAGINAKNTVTTTTALNHVIQLCVLAKAKMLNKA